MGLFRKKVDKWKNAYQAEPNVYRKPNGKSFGAFTLTEGTVTIFPTSPEQLYRMNGSSIKEWKMIVYSTSKDMVVGDSGYFKALKNLENYIIERKTGYILVKGLNTAELELIVE